MEVLEAVAKAESASLNRAIGKIYQVDFKKKSFEFITRTAYDPQSDEGKTRYTVHWHDKTQFVLMRYQTSFKGMTGSFSGLFYYLSADEQANIKAGHSFSTRELTVSDAGQKVTGLRKDGKVLSAHFRVIGSKKAEVILDGKQLIYSVGRKTKVALSRVVTQDYLKRLEQSGGLIRARLFGEVKDDQFALNRIHVTPLPDPRAQDEPHLPRMLVIGDSISANYDQAARKALAGVVNYHRIEGNGGSSLRGVQSADLWLGDYQQPGFHWDIIQFNHGLHDLKQKRNEDGSENETGTVNVTWGAHAIELDQYKKNLEKVIAILKKTKATLIWCNTSPVPNDTSGGSARRKDEDLIYNKAALEVISKYPEILITDLNRAIRQSTAFDQWRLGSNVHFKTEMELKVLGETVAATVKKIVEESK